jgi:hypothetical protein
MENLPKMKRLIPPIFWIAEVSTELKAMKEMRAPANRNTMPIMPTTICTQIFITVKPN